MDRNAVLRGFDTKLCFRNLEFRSAPYMSDHPNIIIAILTNTFKADEVAQNNVQVIFTKHIFGLFTSVHVGKVEQLLN